MATHFQSAHPSLTIFLHPEVAEAAEVIARLRHTSVGAIARGAIVYGVTAGITLTSRQLPGGRTRKVKFHVAAEVKAMLRDVCHFEGVQMSTWMARAMTAYVIEVSREGRGMPPSNTMLRVAKVLREHVPAELMSRYEAHQAARLAA